MYKYFRTVKQHSILLLVLYCLFAVRLSKYEDSYGNIKVYAKINWWNPIIAIIILVLTIFAIFRSIYKILTEDLKEFFTINQDDYRKGLFVGFYQDQNNKKRL